MTAGLRTSLHHPSFKTSLIKPIQTNKTRNKTQETSQQNFSKSTTEFTTRSFAPQNNGSIYLLAYCSKLRTSYVNFSPSCSCSSVKSIISILISDFFYLSLLNFGSQFLLIHLVAEFMIHFPFWVLSQYLTDLIQYISGCRVLFCGLFAGYFCRIHPENAQKLKNVRHLFQLKLCRKLPSLFIFVVYVLLFHCYMR